MPKIFRPRDVIKVRSRRAFPDIEPNTRVTQVSLEQFYAANPDSQITQTALEMWAANSTVSGQNIVTLAALEMWAPSIVRTGKVNVWNGSAWIPEDVLSIRAGGTWDTALWDTSYWAPDTWRTVPVKVWKGSSWELAK